MRPSQPLMSARAQKCASDVFQKILDTATPRCLFSQHWSLLMNLQFRRYLDRENYEKFPGTFFWEEEWGWGGSERDANLFFFFHCFKDIAKWNFHNISQGIIWTDYALTLACRSFANCPDYKWPLRDIMWNKIAYYSDTQRFLQDILVLKKLEPAKIYWICFGITDSWQCVRSQSLYTKVSWEFLSLEWILHFIQINTLNNEWDPVGTDLEGKQTRHIYPGGDFSKTLNTLYLTE